MKGMRSDQMVFSATHSPTVHQSLMAAQHVPGTVHREDEERVLTATGLSRVRVKPHVMLPRHVTEWRQPRGHGNILICIELEIVCCPEQPLSQSLGDDIASTVGKPDEPVTQEPVRLRVFATPAVLGSTTALKVAPVEVGVRGERAM